MKKILLSFKFYIGVALIIGSLILGKLTIATFIWAQGEVGQWISVIIYILSWPMLIWGAWLAGKEYADSMRKYNSIKFYHESAKKGAAHVVKHGKRVHGKVVSRVKKRKVVKKKKK